MHSCATIAIFASLPKKGGLAQMARAPHWQCGGHRFESGILHFFQARFYNGPFLCALLKIALIFCDSCLPGPKMPCSLHDIIL